jgi:Protein of unknown function (DUF3037)
MTETRMAYQYVVLRCVPRADREEFVNVGVVVYCEEARFLDLKWQFERARLLALDPGLDLKAVQAALESHQLRCDSNSTDEPLGGRFGMLKAPRSTVLQPGPVHGGVTDDPAQELDALLARLVAPS